MPAPSPVSPRRGAVALFVLLAASAPIAPLAAQTRKAPTGEIRSAEIGEHLRRLAGTELEGRRAGSRSLRRAADYLAEHFASLGLEAGGAEGSYLRMWDATILRPKVAECSFAFELGQENEEFTVGEQWMPTWRGAEGKGEGELVFCGYGIDADKYRYNDFAGLSLKGKVAVVFWSEPRHDRAGKFFEGKETTSFSDYDVKAAACEERGAVAVLVVPAPSYEEREGPLDFELPRMTGNEGAGRGAGWKLGIPVVSISVELAGKLLGTDPAALQKKLDGSLKVPKLDLEGRKVRVRVALETVTAPEPNVVAIRKGDDPELSSEYVLLGAHFDHEGRRPDGAIFHGADDNASGTSVLLTMASAFAKAPTRRTLVFVAFSGEERGLLGSQAYAAAPHTPLDRCAAMLNIDMVGRGEPKKVQVGGTWDRPDLATVLRSGARAARTGMELDLESGKDLWNRSDQYHFDQRGVPALFFFGGFHEDYHKITDTADKIDLAKAERIGRLVAATCFELAEADEAPRRSR